MADRYRSWGATMIDVGGQSSHLDNPTIESTDEIARVVPVIEALVAERHLVAIDTWKPDVAGAAVSAGAVIVNDTGGLTDPEMRQIVAQAGVDDCRVRGGRQPPRGWGNRDQGRQGRSNCRRFRSLLSDLAGMGIDNVILDPGIALNYRGDYEAYTSMQLQVIAGSEQLRALGKPVLIPIPRKRDFHRVVAYISLALSTKPTSSGFTMSPLPAIWPACSVAPLDLETKRVCGSDYRQVMALHLGPVECGARRA